jgi:hypothetical protein
MSKSNRKRWLGWMVFLTAIAVGSFDVAQAGEKNAKAWHCTAASDQGPTIEAKAATKSEAKRNVIEAYREGILKGDKNVQIKTECHKAEDCPHAKK